ncbi:MAG: hypothetical protein AAB821_01920 [Patescibacteria group bacterium]
MEDLTEDLNEGDEQKEEGEKTKEKKGIPSKIKDAAVKYITASWSRVDNTTALLMMIFCLLIDGLQILLAGFVIGLFINWMITILMWLTMWFWLKLHNVSMVDSPLKLTDYCLTLAIDFFPGTELTALLSFPWTVGMFIMISLVRIEDVTGINVNIKSIKKGMTSVGK